MLHEVLNQCASRGNPSSQKVYIQHKFPNHERGVRKFRDKEHMQQCECQCAGKKSVTCHNKKRKEKRKEEEEEKEDWHERGPGRRVGPTISSSKKEDAKGNICVIK